jgi:ankyrin repeat protein
MQARDREFSQLVDPAADTKGFTALHYACLSSSLETVVLLAKAGCGARFLDGKIHSRRGPLVPTPARLKRLHVCVTNDIPLGWPLSYRFKL